MNYLIIRCLVFLANKLMLLRYCDIQHHCVYVSRSLYVCQGRGVEQSSDA